jgi:L-threonylcarbamoyladenylate synthase
LYAVKRRPLDHPVIVHVVDAAQLDELAGDVPDVGRVLARACWPGPLTLVVRRRRGAVADEASGGRETVGVRVPAHPLARALLARFGGPIAAPSANRFGRVSPTTAAHVRDDLGDDVDVILDGGPCTIGVESTIVDVTGEVPVVLRVGGVSEERLAELLSEPLARRTDGEVAAPGTLPSHYAPNARVDLVHSDDISARAEALRATGMRVAVLDAPCDVVEYARVLYTRLRDADALGVDVILATVPDDDGSIGTAVRDRLQRAATR